jgi:probable H4MPT-linked C1 transfer pathway protein
MPSTILGLDIGGANLKAATPDKRAISVPFALWKQPDKLAAALTDLIARFSDAAELAVTMTGELCDCYETRREGVNSIIQALRSASGSRRVGLWSTDGVFVDAEKAAGDYLKVASANWHALAMFAGRFAPHYGGLVFDIGSTTTDIIPLNHGVPSTMATVDWDRLARKELVYIGVRRTPVCAVSPKRVCAEFFATTEDVYLLLGMLPEEPNNRITADGRPATREFSFARLARMLGADRGIISDDHITHFATQVDSHILETLSASAVRAYYDTQKLPELRSIVVAGVGEFLARRVIESCPRLSAIDRIVSLTEQLGPEVSACAPAYAVAVLASEQS